MLCNTGKCSLPEADIFRRTQRVTHKTGADSQESLRQAQVEAHMTDRQDERHKESREFIPGSLRVTWHQEEVKFFLNTTLTHLLVTGCSSLMCSKWRHTLMVCTLRQVLMSKMISGKATSQSRNPLWLWSECKLYCNSRSTNFKMQELPCCQRTPKCHVLNGTCSSENSFFVCQSFAFYSQTMSPSLYLKNVTTSYHL